MSAPNVPGGTNASASFFARYKQRVMDRARRAAGALPIHVLGFGAVNAFLFILNLLTGVSFPWFLFPLGATAMLLSAHWGLVRQRRRQVQEVSPYSTLPLRRAEPLRKLHRLRTAFALHLNGAVSTSAFLVMTNLIVSRHFLWSAIPVSALLLTAAVHYVALSPRRKRLAAEFSDVLAAPGDRVEPASLAAVSDGASASVNDVGLLKERILAHLATLTEEHASLREEIAPLIERFVAQIGILTRQRAEIESVVGPEAGAAIERERKRLTESLKIARSEQLRAEYRRALDQVAAHQSSIDRLLEQREIADLRISTALASLEQLQLDIVRMKSQSNFDESAVFRMLESKSRELTVYLDDLERSRRELDAPQS